MAKELDIINQNAIKFFICFSFFGISKLIEITSKRAQGKYMHTKFPENKYLFHNDKTEAY